MGGKRAPSRQSALGPSHEKSALSFRKKKENRRNLLIKLNCPKKAGQCYDHVGFLKLLGAIAYRKPVISSRGGLSEILRSAESVQPNRRKLEGMLFKFRDCDVNSGNLAIVGFSRFQSPPDRREGAFSPSLHFTMRD